MATSLMLTLAVILGAGSLVALWVLRDAVSRAVEEIVMLTLDEEPPWTVSHSARPDGSTEASRGPHDAPASHRIRQS